MQSIEVYENAILTANVLDDANRTVLGALYSTDGKIIKSSRRSIDRLDRYQPVDPAAIDRHSPVIGHHNREDGYDLYLEEAVFGGHVFAGWGHNITETISTAWSASEIDTDIPLVMIPWGRLWVSALPRIRETMRLAGWGDRKLILVSGSAAFGKVYVPDRLVKFDELLHLGTKIPDKMNKVYDLMIERSTSSDEVPEKRPTFLARSRGHRRLHPNEVDFETALKTSGFRIVEGWDMSVKDQIAVINSSSALVAFSGSSLHNSVFADRGIPVFEILDERATSSNRTPSPLQAALCELRQQPFTTIDGYRDGNACELQDMLDELVNFAIPAA